MHGIDMIPQRVSGFGVLATYVTTDPWKLDMSGLHMSGHVILSGHDLATRDALPNLLANVVRNLPHE